MQFNWTTVAVVILNLLIGGIWLALIKRKPTLDKLANEREANLLSERAKEMEDMRERIGKLEAALAQKASDHAAEVKALTKFHEAKEAHDRHRINNLNTQMQSLLMLLKKGVSVEEAVSEIEGMREKHQKLETEEAAIIRGAAIKAGLAEPDL